MGGSAANLACSSLRVALSASLATRLAPVAPVEDLDPERSVFFVVVNNNKKEHFFRCAQLVVTSTAVGFGCVACPDLGGA